MRSALEKVVKSPTSDVKKKRVVISDTTETNEFIGGFSDQTM